MQLIAFLGSHPSLSLAELESVSGVTIDRSQGETALFETENIDAHGLMAKLGGTKKLAMVIGTIAKFDEQEVVDFLATDLLASSAEGKINFGLSAYNLGDKEAVLKIREALKKAGINLKIKIREEGRSARFVISREEVLSSVVIQKNHLLDKGAEYVFLVGKDEIVIGKTLAVQDFADWSKRDYDRPRRNAKQGMLPPKLARMMINLAGVDPKGKVLLDPFCGSGTVLMEGAMLGCSKLVAGDIYGGAIHDTRENLQWLAQQSVSVPKVETFTSSAQDLAPQLPPASVDLLVTETYLGRPRKGLESKVEILEAITYVEKLYEESFGSLKTILAPGATVIIAAPIHYLGDETFEPTVEQIFTKLGFTPSPLPHSPLIYRRDDQFVGRHIFRFKV